MQQFPYGADQQREANGFEPGSNMWVKKFTAQYWRMKAEEARTLADEMHDQMTRRMMLDIVAGYEQMAVRTEKLEQEARQSSLGHVPVPSSDLHA